MRINEQKNRPGLSLVKCQNIYINLFICSITFSYQKLETHDKQDQQGKAAFNERNPHMTQQQEPMARSPGGPQTETGQGKDRADSLNRVCHEHCFKEYAS
jgi:hypothetical protein